MTPTSSAEDHHSPDPMGEEEDTTPPASPGTEKKPTKKRKSWGQVLPEPKTNLPPRKRAKTEDEKEQRRVERVLRNRRAAQSSRERKRQEVEALEKRNKELESLLANAQKANLMLVEELRRFRSDSGVVTRTSTDTFKDNHLTLSPELFGAQAGQGLEPTMKMLDDLIKPAEQTVNPASLSPPPESDEVKQEPSEDDLKQSNESQIPVLNADLDICSLGIQSSAQDDVAFSFNDSFGLSAAINTDRHVLESGLLSSPESSYLDDDHLAGDSATGFFHQSTFGLDINEILSDEANNTVSDLMAASHDAAADFFGLEPQIYDFETQISSENPIQQPQSGASSFGCDDGGIAETREVDRELTQCLRNIALPSKEVLMTLSWALKVEIRKLEKRQQDGDGMVAVFGPESCVPNDGKYQPTKHYTITLTGKRYGVEDPSGSTKRRRLA
ncbi:unnamed protein product [Clonostachys rhizophaga]|uniref:BZIP domain-containing protein n=1 Tax=Clonostachys rhizophaga TaxID=160324 RepID=A0A9N9V118_9HYPO|nr:unnamed protein product [Clonostachys rhizophaga]